MHALITGASSGIGEALARAFAAAGHPVTLVARRAAELERVAAGLSGAEVRTLPADLAVLDGLAGLVERAEAGLGPIEILVNNAGTQIVAPTEKIASADAERLMALNVLAPFRLVRLVLPGMLARQRGVIVDISSLSALTTPPGMYYYGASKAALAAASESLRAEVRGRGVHVVTVYPGPIKTEMESAARARYDKPAPPMPSGTTDELARRVVRAVARRKPRVIYPRFFGLARTFPGISRWVTDLMSPMPKDIE
jgi:short-subunit dehydrogenase